MLISRGNLKEQVHQKNMFVLQSTENLPGKLWVTQLVSQRSELAASVLPSFFTEHCTCLLKGPVLTIKQVMMFSILLLLPTVLKVSKC